MHMGFIEVFSELLTPGQVRRRMTEGSESRTASLWMQDELSDTVCATEKSSVRQSQKTQFKKSEYRQSHEDEVCEQAERPWLRGGESGFPVVLVFQLLFAEYPGLNLTLTSSWKDRLEEPRELRLKQAKIKFSRTWKLKGGQFVLETFSVREAVKILGENL